MRRKAIAAALALLALLLLCAGVSAARFLWTTEPFSDAVHRLNSDSPSHPSYVPENVFDEMCVAFDTCLTVRGEEPSTGIFAMRQISSLECKTKGNRCEGLLNFEDCGQYGCSVSFEYVISSGGIDRSPGVHLGLEFETEEGVSLFCCYDPVSREMDFGIGEDARLGDVSEGLAEELVCGYLLNTFVAAYLESNPDSAFSLDDLGECSLVVSYERRDDYGNLTEVTVLERSGLVNDWFGEGSVSR